MDWVQVILAHWEGIGAQGTVRVEPNRRGVACGARMMQVPTNERRLA
jgi:hypothetical protein